jgi:hypothetical protein
VSVRRAAGTLAAAATWFVAASCGGEDGGSGPKPASAFKVMAELDGGGGVVIVTHDGAPVTDAQVSLNGTPGTTGSAAGEYLVTLGTAVSPGGILTLEVESGDASVASSHAVPHPPVILEPPEVGVLAPEADIGISWTTGSNPDEFVVEAIGASTLRFPVPNGATRALILPAGTLAEGDWEIRMLAVRDGFIAGVVESGSRMRISTAGMVRPALAIARLIGVWGGVNSYNASIAVSRATQHGWELVPDATVTVNGMSLLPVEGGSFIGTFPSPLPVGTSVTVRVTTDRGYVEGVGPLPESVVITDPADGYTVGTASELTVNWTSIVDPDVWSVTLRGYLHYGPYSPAGSARSATFAAGSIDPGEYSVVIYGNNVMDLTGHVAPESRIQTETGNDAIPRITVTP